MLGQQVLGGRRQPQKGRHFSHVNKLRENLIKEWVWNVRQRGQAWLLQASESQDGRKGVLGVGSSQAQGLKEGMDKQGWQSWIRRWKLHMLGAKRAWASRSVPLEGTISSSHQPWDTFQMR